MQTATPSREPEGVAQWEENLSAWLDGESTLDWPENIDTAAGRQTWDAYHLIGDVLRAGDLGAEPSPAFRRRLAEALDKELPIVAPRRRHVVKVGLSGLAVAAAVAIKLPALFGVDGKGGADVLARNAGVLVLPCLTAFFAWKRRVARSTIAWLAGVFAVAAVLANLPEFGASRAFEALTALHLPIALSMAVGVAYVGGRWREESGRMDFIRFSGEWFIHYVLIALGGGVLCAFMALTFHTIGIDIEHFFGSWLLPCGAAGAVVIASWWAEAKQNVVENIAPVLTRIFTPLFAAMLIAFLAALVWSGRVVAIDRDLLIGFDLLLVVVLGLVVYSMSARDPHAPRGTFDVLQVALVVSALLADAVALAAIAARIGEFGLSPNRVAALGENIILLTNLAGSGVLYLWFLLGRGTFRALERWQTGFLPVYAIWAAIVVAVFPIVFRFV